MRKKILSKTAAFVVAVLYSIAATAGPFTGGGGFTNPIINDGTSVQGVAIGATAPTSGQVLTAQGSASAVWVNSPKSGYNGIIAELGLSLVDRGYAPAWSTGASVRNQFTNSNPLHLALQRMRKSGTILTSAGKSGDTGAGALGRWNADVMNAIPQPSSIWYMNGGNDINTVNTFADVNAMLTTYSTSVASTWGLARANGMGFGIEALPDNGTWTADSIAAGNSFGVRGYARASSFWRMHRWHKEAARLNGFPFINYNAGFTYAARQIPIAGSSDTISSTTTTGSFVMPPASALLSPVTVAVNMTSTAAFSVGDFVNIATAGVFLVNTVTSGTQLALLNYGVTGSATPGSTIATSKTVSMGTVTLASAHGWADGDFVLNYTIAPAPQLVVTALPINVTAGTTFTYPAPDTSVVTVQGSWQRTGIPSALAADGTVHYNSSGAFQLSYLAEEALQYGVTDWLSESEADSQNITSVGTAGATYQVFNRGMMQGTTGTYTSITNTSGTVPTGWDVKQLAGPAGGTAACSSVASTDPGRPYMTHMRCTLTAAAGTTDTQFSIHIPHTKPSAWAATAVKSQNNWIRPTTENGRFYIVVTAGTTGSVEPTWGTAPGAQVTDGTVVWEARQGYIQDSATKYWLGAYFQLISATTSSALQSRAFGLWDDTTMANSITDGDSLDNIPGPVYQVGEITHLQTPDAILGTATTTFDLGLRLWVTQGTAITIEFDRATWFRAGCGTGCNPTGYGSLGGI